MMALFSERQPSGSMFLKEGCDEKPIANAADSGDFWNYKGRILCYAGFAKLEAVNSREQYVC